MPPAATMNDMITATDTHIIMVPTPAGEVPTPPIPHPYAGTISTAVSANVMICGQPAATLGSGSTFTHIPQGPRFMVPPTGIGTIIKGSATVMINKKPAARMGDTCMTCNDPAPLPVGSVVVVGARTVNIGG